MTQKLRPRNTHPDFCVRAFAFVLGECVNTRQHTAGVASKQRQHNTRPLVSPKSALWSLNSRIFLSRYHTSAASQSGRSNAIISLKLVLFGAHPIFGPSVRGFAPVTACPAGSHGPVCLPDRSVPGAHASACGGRQRCWPGRERYGDCGRPKWRTAG